jgi:hypothetical protein
MIVYGVHARRCFGGDTNSFSFCVGFNEPPQVDHPAVDGRIRRLVRVVGARRAASPVRARRIQSE